MSTFFTVCCGHVFQDSTFPWSRIPSTVVPWTNDVIEAKTSTLESNFFPRSCVALPGLNGWSTYSVDGLSKQSRSDLVEEDNFRYFLRQNADSPFALTVADQKAAQPTLQQFLGYWQTHTWCTIWSWAINSCNTVLMDSFASSASSPSNDSTCCTSIISSNRSHHDVRRHLQHLPKRCLRQLHAFCWQTSHWELTPQAWLLNTECILNKVLWNNRFGCQCADCKMLLQRTVCRFRTEAQRIIKLRLRLQWLLSKFEDEL